MEDRKMRKVAELCLCVLLAAVTVQAADRQWTGGVDGNWGTAGNWSTGVPVAGDRAYFTSATPGTTSVILNTDYTLDRQDLNAANVLYFNTAHNYTINGPGTLTFISTESATTRNVLNIGSGAAGTTQTINSRLIFDMAGAAGHRISTTTNAHWVFNGDILGKQTFNVRLNDLNSSATFNGNIVLTNSAVLQVYGGTINFKSAISGAGGVINLQGQGRDNLTVLGNTSGAVFDSSLRLNLGVAPGNSTTLRLDEDDQIAANIWLRTAVLDMNGRNNTNAGRLSLATDGDTATIDFSNAAAEALWFADSSAQAWAAATVLDLIGFDFELDQLRFGTDANGLTAQQLSQIRFDGQVINGVMLDSSGFLAIPEPATIGMLGLGALIVMISRRKFSGR